MHIPDGLMDPLVAAAGWIIALSALAVVTRRLDRRMDDRRLPLMALLAAGVFVAQMINFPVGGGTSGHLVGAALAAILLGPAAGMAVMMVILAIQCLLFGDGGITALGLNFLNMGVIGCLAGYYVFRAFPVRYRNAGIFAASWLAVFLGAAACAAELAASSIISGGDFGIAPFIAFPSMMIFYAIIGVGEAIITTGILAFLAHVAPGMLDMPGARSTSGSNDKDEVAPDA
jgi:cobalt/nickel transport system permease protein